MSTKLDTPVAAESGIFSPVQVRPRWERQAELADATTPITIASARRGDPSAVVLGGSVDDSVMEAVRAHLRGLLDGGSRHLVVDLSRVGRLDNRLPALLRRVEARMAARGGVLELTGLTSRVLHDMDDDLLARVFALSRAAFEGAHPRELAGAAVRCPGGLDEVAEPDTPARHRATIDRAGRRTPGYAVQRPGSTGALRPGPRRGA